LSDRSLYDLLNVPKNVSAEDLKKSYRKLARKLHPDVNPGDEAAEARFKEVSAAYEVLSDPERRKLYDEFGEDATKVGFDPEKARAYKRWQEQSGRTGGFGADPGFGADFDLSDLFAGAFGGAGRPGSRRPRGPRAGANLRAELELDFVPAMLGTETEVTLRRPHLCDSCSGQGHRAGAGGACSSCEGRGTRRVAQGPLQFHGPCPDCDGTGRARGPRCSACSGSGTVDRTVTLAVRVPAGIETGKTIRLRGQGAPGLGGGPPGDLLVKVRLRDHAVFRRRGGDLEFELPVTVGEALLGAKVDVPTLSGTVALTIPRGVQSGQKLRLRSMGVPGRGDKPAGDLYAVLSVRVPKVPPVGDGQRDPAREAAELLAPLYAENVRANLLRRA
jgi:molecular chaperone DnaJ